jgi:hypothetical protein
VRIDVTSDAGTLTKAERERARRRVLLALSRFEGDLFAVRARLGSSPNPLLGESEVLCRMRALLRGGLVLEAEAIDDASDGAVARAANRVALLAQAALEDDAPDSRSRRSGRS